MILALSQTRFNIIAKLVDDSIILIGNARFITIHKTARIRVNAAEP